MSEFWERFAFYGIRWAMVLSSSPSSMAATPPAKAGQRTAIRPQRWSTASAIFGGYVADKLIGYQRSILLGAVVMSAGLFLLASPTRSMFKLGLATIIVGNGLFQAIISTMVRQALRAGR